jgi:hypothetical protein
VDIDKAYIMG